MNVVTKYSNRHVAAENWSSTHPLDGWRCSSFSAMQKSTHYVASDCYRVVADCGVFVSNNAHADEAFARFTWEVMRRTQNPELDVSAVPNGTAPGNPVLDDINRKPVRFDVY